MALPLAVTYIYEMGPENRTDNSVHTRTPRLAYPDPNLKAAAV